MVDRGAACPTGRTRHGDRISASVAHSRTVSGSREASSGNGPYRCEDCSGWHVPVAIPMQRVAGVSVAVTR